MPVSKRISTCLDKYGDCALSMVEAAEVLGITPERARELAARVKNPLPTFELPSTYSRPQRKCWYSELHEWAKGGI